MQKVAETVFERTESYPSVYRNLSDQLLYQSKVGNLYEMQDTLHKLNKVRKNLNGALQILQDFVEFEKEIANIQAELERFAQLDSSMNLLAMYKKLKTMLRVKKNLELRTQDSKQDMLREKYRDLEEANKRFERIVLTVMTRDLPKNMGQSDPKMIVMVLRVVENEHLVDGL